MEVFLRALERLIDRAAPNLPNELRNRQLIDYFLEGLPTPVADQLFILAPKTLEETVTRARELMLLEKRRGLGARRIAGVTACEDDDEEESASGHIMRAVRAISDRLDTLEKTSHPVRGEAKQTQRNCKQVQCFGCGEYGHYMLMIRPK